MVKTTYENKAEMDYSSCYLIEQYLLQERFIHDGSEKNDVYGKSENTHQNGSTDYVIGDRENVNMVP